MLVAAPSDRKLVVAILCRSFDTNPSVSFVIGQHGNRQQRLKALMEYSFDLCCESGCIYINEERTACALILFHDKKKTTLRSAWRDVKLIFNAIGVTHVPKILKRNNLISAQYPVTPFYYLWFIGVMPEVQRKGIGNNMLQYLIADSEKMNRPLLLETSVAENIAWYKKAGFYVYHQLSYGYHLYFLKRAAGVADPIAQKS